MKQNGDIIKFLKEKDYQMIDNDLGFGSFGEAVLLKDPFIDELLVAKKYKPYLEEKQKQFYNTFLQEIKIMYKLNHRNIVRIYNYYAYESFYTGYIIMEYIQGQNIEAYLEDSYAMAEDNVPDDLFVQLVDGFDYIEKQGVIHRDIRADNILVTRDGIVKIIDFGLGKTFSPSSTSKDSMLKEINRMGVDCLPKEHFEGQYDSLTDMFYLAELFNRLLYATNTAEYFSYKNILEKMMAIERKDRYSSFAEIKEAIAHKDFSVIKIKTEDKNIYQNFTNAIYNYLMCYLEKREFVDNIQTFLSNLRNAAKANCFEDIIQNNSILISTIVKSRYRYSPKTNIPCEILNDFLAWFEVLSLETQELVFNNIKIKLSNIKVVVEEEIPF